MRFLVMIAVVLVCLLPLAAQDLILTDVPTGVQYQVEQYLPANFPVGMVFAPDGRLFYNEKTTGNVRVVGADGTLHPNPVINFPTDALQERGMLGIALDPDFANNQFIYIVHTRLGTTRDWPANQLVRFRLEDNQGLDPQVLMSVPIDTGILLHNGGNVHFDDEGYLFITFGDYGNAAHGQDLSVPQAKIHRFSLTPDGLQPAAGNPFGDDNSAYAYGLRNLFDFTFDPYTGHIFGSEVGPDCDDEINLILPGLNYGWREGYECVGLGIIAGLQHLYAPPLLSFTPVIAPTGIIVYDHPAIPEWQGDLFFCDWVFGDMQRVELNETRNKVVSVNRIDLGGATCRVDLVIGPDGGLYFGTVGDFGGAIMRLLPTNP